MVANLKSTVEALDLSIYNQIQTEIINFKELSPEKPENYDVKVKLVRNQNGAIGQIDYYINDALQKSALYNGSELTKVKVVRRDNIILEEEWLENKLSTRIYGDSNGNHVYSLEFKYTEQNKIQRINKYIGENQYAIEYAYDEFGRVNSRRLIYNNFTLEEQNYKFDILDRVSYYEDGTKKIFVWKRSSNNELLSYSVVDSNGNEKVINNIFDENGYKETEITTGNRKLVVCEPRYADHSALKKPYTTEDDLNLVMAQYVSKTKQASKK